MKIVSSPCLVSQVYRVTVCTHQLPPQVTEVTCWLLSNASVLIWPAQTCHHFLLLPQVPCTPFFTPGSWSNSCLPFIHTLSSRKFQLCLPGKKLNILQVHISESKLGGWGWSAEQVWRSLEDHRWTALWGCGFREFYLRYLCMLKASLNKCLLL